MTLLTSRGINRPTRYSLEPSRGEKPPRYQKALPASARANVGTSSAFYELDGGTYTIGAQTPASRRGGSLPGCSRLGSSRHS